MIEYLRWQYAEGASELVRAWVNVQRFLLDFFSVKTLAKSFFAPFHRMQERKKRGFDAEDIAQVFVANMVTRFVGMFIRSILIVLGLAAEICGAVAGGVFLVLAFLAPIVVPGAIIVGIWLLFR